MQSKSRKLLSVLLALLMIVGVIAVTPVTASAAFVPAANITNGPSQALAGRAYPLYGIVAPSDATYKAITWSVKDAGTTGAAITGGDTLNTTAAGTVVLTATVINGGDAVGANAVGIDAISAGTSYSMVLKKDGSIWAWGANDYGQLGLGSGGDGSNKYDTSVPYRIGSDKDWAFIEAGYRHTAAIKTDGSLWTWGYNAYGQLGNGTTVSKNVPTRVGTANDWATVSVGMYHTVAVKTDGTLWAWGRNNLGQVGDGTTTDRNAPVRIGTATNWKTVEAGEYHTVALQNYIGGASGFPYAWGKNNYNQLGTATANGQGGGANILSPAGFGYPTAAISSSGARSNHAFSQQYSMGLPSDNWRMWGRNNYRQTSDIPVPTMGFQPFDFSPLAKAVVSTGNSYWLYKDGRIWARGDNQFGQLANSTTTGNEGFVGQVGVSTWLIDYDWADVSAGTGHVMALKTDGSLWMWGNNGSGQLGNGTSGTGKKELSPIKITMPAVEPVDFKKDFTVTVLAVPPVIPPSSMTMGPAAGAQIYSNSLISTTFPEIIYVQFDQPVLDDTIVTVTSNNPNVTIPGTLGVPNQIVVAYGQARSPVLLTTGAATGPATLTATFGSHTATATVNVVPVAPITSITLTPVTARVMPGDTLTLTVTADHAAPPTGFVVNLSATAGGTVPAMLVIPANMDSATFGFVAGASEATVTVTASGAGVTNKTATITIALEEPTAADFTFNPGETTANGSPQGVIVTPLVTGMGAITTFYNGSATAPSAAGTYTISVNVGTGLSYAAKTGIVLGMYTINPALRIAAQPAPATATTGQAATFGVAAADGSAPYEYQWQVNTGGGWNDVTDGMDETSAVYTTAETTFAMSGWQYRCIVTDASGASVTSNAAALTVNPAPISLAAIAGVTPPSFGAAPVTAITATDQYTGTVTWSPAPGATFAASTAYTATIILTPKAGYTLTGVAANFFTVAGATTVTNSASSGVITAVFPATGTAPATAVTLAAISGVTAPANGATAVTTVPETAQYTGTVTWSPALVGGKFAASTTYTATITLTPKTGYTFTGVAANFFTVAGATTVTNPANSGVITVTFPATGTAPATSHTVTVVGGTANPTTATVGQTVTVTANAPATSFLTGQVFKEWTGATFANKGSATTTFVMPDSNVTVTATYDKMIRLWGKTTRYKSDFLNWLLCILLFGWIWMAF